MKGVEGVVANLTKVKMGSYFFKVPGPGCLPMGYAMLRGYASGVCFGVCFGGFEHYSTIYFASHHMNIHDPPKHKPAKR